MEPADIAAALAYAASLDENRLDVNDDPTLDMWLQILAPVSVDVETAKTIIRDYYGTAGTGRPGQYVPPISPGQIKVRAQVLTSQRDARRRAALPPAPRHRRPSLRQRDPAEWDRLFAQGRRERADALAQRGIDPTPQNVHDVSPAKWRATLDAWERDTGHAATR